jgi:hypothetical protein
MTTPTDDDFDDVPEAELLALPGEAIPAGRLTAFFTRRAEVLRQHELDELAFERSGNSARHFLIFPDTDPKQRQLREEEARRRAWLAELEMLWKLGLDFVNWRCLRTSYSTWLKEAKADVKDAQKLMRHSRVTTTLEIHQQFIPESQRKVVDGLIN